MSRTSIASLFVLAGALVFGVVLGFVLAFGSSKTDPWEERWRLLGIPEAEFVFLGEFTPAEQESIRRELRVAQVVYAEHFGAVTSEFTVYLLSNDLYAERIVSVFDGEYHYQWMCGFVVPGEAIIVAPRDCPQAIQRPFLAHEYFRVLQDDAGGLAWRRQAGTARQTAWLDWIETGSAFYASVLVSNATGRVPLDDMREGARTIWAVEALSFPRDPSEIANPEILALYAYPVGFLATDWLVERAGPDSILKFFRFGGHSAAFEAAFGMTLDEFHIAFEEHRREVAVPFERR